MIKEDLIYEILSVVEEIPEGGSPPTARSPASSAGIKIPV